MNLQSSLPVLFFVACITISNQDVRSEEVLLEDYEGGGQFSPADWANTYADSEGNANSSRAKDGRAVVEWATKWAGLPSTGSSHDMSAFKTYQVDVMVEKGQPVEEGANFYFQLLNESPEGYSYWEVFVPQTKVPADGKWYRIRFPIDQMATGFGDGGVAPQDFKTIAGCVCGMTFDEGGMFKMKRAQFDNVTLTDDAVSETEVKPLPESSQSKAD